MPHQKAQTSRLDVVIHVLWALAQAEAFIPRSRHCYYCASAFVWCRTRLPTVNSSCLDCYSYTTFSLFPLFLAPRNSVSRRKSRGCISCCNAPRRPVCSPAGMDFCSADIVDRHVARSGLFGFSWVLECVYAGPPRSPPPPPAFLKNEARPVPRQAMLSKSQREPSSPPVTVCVSPSHHHPRSFGSLLLSPPPLLFF